MRLSLLAQLRAGWVLAKARVLTVRRPSFRLFETLVTDADASRVRDAR